MIDDNTLAVIIKTFNDYILSPIMYIYDNPDEVLIVCFYDQRVESDDVVRAEEYISAAAGVKVRINDIRVYDAIERMDVVQNADISYCEDRRASNDFFNSLLQDYLMEMSRRAEVLLRGEETETIFFQ